MALSLATFERMVKEPVEHWNIKGFEKTIIDTWFTGDDKDTSFSWLENLDTW